MAERVDCVVIGAGVVGLAVARMLAMAEREVIIVERADAIGTETSARNSEVIHAGIYYPKGSLKAKYCVAGKHALYDYCEAAGVGHQRCGKLIVATRDDDSRAAPSEWDEHEAEPDTTEDGEADNGNLVVVVEGVGFERYPVAPERLHHLDHPD